MWCAVWSIVQTLPLKLWRSRHLGEGLHWGGGGGGLRKLEEGERDAVVSSLETNHSRTNHQGKKQHCDDKQ